MSKNTYLYVPYEYKDRAKLLGAKWDVNKKKWYTTEANINYTKLIDTFHDQNFFSDYHGTHMKSEPKTFEEVLIEKKQKREHYKQTLDQHIANGGVDDDNFRKSYSVNYRNCD